MGREIVHPPNPTGATSRELGIVQRLHRAATTTDDPGCRPAMMDGLGLLVTLIEARNRRQLLADQFEHNQETGWDD